MLDDHHPEVYHAVWATSPAAEAPQVREYAKFRLKNMVKLGHELEHSLRSTGRGSLGYYVQGAVEETNTLRWYAEGALTRPARPTSRSRNYVAGPL